MLPLELNIVLHLTESPYDFRLLPEDFPSEVFTDEMNRELYKALYDLHQRRMSIDKAVVAEWASSYSKLNKTADFFYQYLTPVNYRPFSASVFSSYVKILLSRYIKVKLTEQATEILSGAKMENMDMESVLNSILHQNVKLKNLFSTKNPANESDAKIYFSTMNKLASGLKAKNFSERVLSGYPIFDEETGGWGCGQLIIIGGRPGMGKTAFMLSALKQMIRTSHLPLAFFSVEHTPEQLMTRLISNASEISYHKMEAGKVTEDEMIQIHEATEFIADSRLHLLQLNECSLEEILDNALRLIKERGIKLLMLDYLQLLCVKTRNFKTRDAEIGYITRALKIFAKEHNIPILISSQLSREVERRGSLGKRPMLSDLRDSGAIEQDASQIVFIYRPAYYGLVEDELGNPVKNVANIIVAKNENGICKDFRFRFTGQYCRFEEFEEDNNGYMNLRKDDFNNNFPF